MRRGLLACDHHAEITPGPFEVRTQVTALDRSSFPLHQHLVQDDQVRIVGRTTVIHKDFVAVRSVPLDADQRAALERHLPRAP